MAAEVDNPGTVDPADQDPGVGIERQVDGDGVSVENQQIGGFAPPPTGSTGNGGGTGVPANIVTNNVVQQAPGTGIATNVNVG